MERNDANPCFDVSTLLFRPPQTVVEGGHEYLLRLAHVNGLPNAKWLVRSNTRPVPMRLCPLCLVEHGTWFQSWRKSVIPICLQHRAWLLDSCSQCASPIRWPHTGWRQCQCGANLETLATETISNSLQSCLESANPVPAEVLLWLGAWAIHGSKGKPLKKATSQSLPARKAILSRGAELACTWPQSFADVLMVHRQPCRPTELQRLNQAWPGLVTQITRLSDSCWRERIWQNLNRFVEGSHFSPSPIIGRNAQLTCRSKTQKAVANELGVGVTRLHTLIADNAPTTPTSSSRCGRSRRVITSDVQVALKQSLSTWISVRESAAILGCDRGRVTALARLRMLETISGKLSRESVLRLRDQVLVFSTPSKADSISESLQHVWRFRVPREKSKEFLEAIFQKRVRIYGMHGVSNWHEVHVDCVDIQGWLLELHQDATRTLSIAEAAIALGVKEQVAYGLVNRGLLQCITEARRGRHITREALTDFSARYIALRELTDVHGKHAHAAFDWAVAQGMQVVTGPRIDGGRQYFVERLPQR